MKTPGISPKKQNAIEMLSSGQIGPVLIKLSLPMLAAQLIQLLYNIVDRMFAGRLEGVGTLALAGLGITLPVVIIVGAVAALFGVGGGNRASIALGQKDIDTAEKLLGNSTILLIVFGLILAIVFTIIRNPLLSFLGATENILPFASEYLRIYLLGTVFILISTGLNSFIMCQGYTSISMITICIGCVLNIALDPILMFSLNMGVKGAALATVISQAVSAIWVILFLIGKKTQLKIRIKNFRISKKIIALIFSIGISPFCMQCTESFIQFAFFSVIKEFGTEEYSALMSILLSLTNVIWLSLSGFSQGTAPLIGYNYGAKNYPRCKKAFTLLFKINITLSVLIAGSMVLFPSAWISLFTNDKSLIELGRLPLRIFIFGGMFFGAQSACQQTLLALGQSKISLFLALLRKVILLFPLTLILPRLFGLGIWGLFWAESISDTIAVCTTITIFCIKGLPLLNGKKEK